MSKKNRRVNVELISYGLYAKWSNSCDELPRFLKYSDKIPARIEAEFGFTLLITNGKGKNVDYIVKHPKISDENGNIEPPFLGSVPIRKSPFTVYLGETLWEPLEEKIGTWEIIAKIDGQVMAKKKFLIIDDKELFSDIIEKHKKDHIN